MKIGKWIFHSIQHSGHLSCKYGHFGREGGGRSAYPYLGQGRQNLINISQNQIRIGQNQIKIGQHFIKKRRNQFKI